MGAYSQSSTLHFATSTSPKLEELGGIQLINKLSSIIGRISQDDFKEMSQNFANQFVSQALGGNSSCMEGKAKDIAMEFGLCDTNGMMHPQVVSTLTEFAQEAYPRVFVKSNCQFLIRAFLKDSPQDSSDCSVGSPFSSSSNSSFSPRSSR